MFFDSLLSDHTSKFKDLYYKINNLICICSMSQNWKATAIYEHVSINIAFMWLWTSENSRLGIYCPKFKWVTLLWDHMQWYILEYDFVELNILWRWFKIVDQQCGIFDSSHRMIL